MSASSRLGRRLLTASFFHVVGSRSFWRAVVDRSRIPQEARAVALALDAPRVNRPCVLLDGRRSVIRTPSPPRWGGRDATSRGVSSFPRRQPLRHVEVGPSKYLAPGRNRGDPDLARSQHGRIRKPFRLPPSPVAESGCAVLGRRPMFGQVSNSADRVRRTNRDTVRRSDSPKSRRVSPRSRRRPAVHPPFCLP
jgi:hypothetical protein